MLHRRFGVRRFSAAFVFLFWRDGTQEKKTKRRKSAALQIEKSKAAILAALQIA